MLEMPVKAGSADFLMGLLLHTVTAGKSTDLAFCIFTATLTLNAMYLVAVGVGVDEKYVLIDHNLKQFEAHGVTQMLERYGVSSSCDSPSW